MVDFVYSKSGEELEQYVGKLREEFERDCQQTGKNEACHQLAEFYDHIERSPAKARPLMQQLCRDKAHAKSCHYLGSMMLAGRGGPRDVKAALELFERACSLGSVEGCHNAGDV